MVVVVMVFTECDASSWPQTMGWGERGGPSEGGRGAQWGRMKYLGCNTFLNNPVKQSSIVCRVGRGGYF